MDFSRLERRPLLLCIAGPNGAGKSTFYQVHLAKSGLRYINPDILAAELELEPYTAAELAADLRDEMVRNQESFIFETVFSDPVGEKVKFLKTASENGYTVELIYIGLESAELSDQRVAMRVSQGGHDVPENKVKSRYPRTMKNLQRAVAQLPSVYIYDNSDISQPYTLLSVYENGKVLFRKNPVPKWFHSLLV